MLLNHFFNGDLGEIPDILSERTKTFTLFLIGVLGLSLVLVTIARIRNEKAISSVLSTIFKSGTLEQTLKENMRIQSLSSFLLLVNYFVSFALCLFIVFHRIYSWDWFLSLVFAVGIPVALFILETAGLFFVGIVTGEIKKISHSLLITLTGNQFTGLVFSILSLLWIMNPEYNFIFFNLFISIFCLKYLIRLFKISFTVLLNRVPWYYIILYFCTLEILPLFVVYFYTIENFLV